MSVWLWKARKLLDQPNDCEILEEDLVHLTT